MSAPQCEQLHAFADGELPGPEAAAFRDHLAGCATCARNLHELLQLDVALHAAASRRTRGQVLPLRRAGPLRSVPLALAAALLLVLGGALLWRAQHTEPAPVLLALAPTRSLEGRLAHGSASGFRPYGVSRAAPAGGGESIPLETLAKLEGQGDAHGLGAAHLLAGELPRAEAALARATASGAGSVDVDSDRALLALERAQPAEALRLLDGVLARAPRHPQALFNRGLALERLGLPLASAEAFRAVAALREPGWAGEAQARAEALEAREQTQHKGWLEVRERGARMVQGGPVLPLELARAHPGLARLYFYDAVRAASAPAALGALAPLARELERGSAAPVLEPLLTRLAAQDFRRRAPLAREYAALAAGGQAAELAARARAAGQADLELGALVLTGQAAAQLPRVKALASASGDPWFSALASLEEGKAQVRAGAPLEAVQTLDAALGACLSARVPYRCAQLHLALARTLTELHRVEEARAHVEGALALARAGGDWGLVQNGLMHGAELERFAGRFPLARALLREAALGDPTDCRTQDFVRGERTSLALLELDGTAAAREHAAAPGCPVQASLAEAAVLADFARRSGAAEHREALSRMLEALRAAPGARPAQLALADHLEGRALLERDRGAGRALLERAARAAGPLVQEDVEAAKAHAYSESLLAVDAARAGEAPRALEAIAAGLGVAAPARCALGVAVDDERLAVVVRDASGQARAQLGSRDAAGPAPAALVPAPLRDALSGCDAVQVLAQAPVQGRAGLLPPDVAWSYRLSHAPAEPAPAPGRRLVVSAVQAPAALGLPALGAWRTDEGHADVVLSGAAATPSRVLAELAQASVVELHVHGLADVEDAAALVLAPEPDGRYALGAREVRATRLRHAPLVILAACHAAKTLPWQHQAWSLPAAFLAAGARAVLASTSEVPDAEAPAFFAGVRRRVEAGAAPAQALRDERQAWLARGGQTWVNDVLLFE